MRPISTVIRSAKIEYWEEIGKKAVKYFTEQRVSPSAEEFARELAELSAVKEEFAKDDETRYFCDYFELRYIPRYKGVRGTGALKIYHTVLNKLRDFERYRKGRLTFESIDIDFYNRFRE